MSKVMNSHLRDMSLSRYVPNMVFLVLVLVQISLDTVVNSFQLTILHTNDVHARFEQYTERDGRCQPRDEAGPVGCFGGIARRATVVKQFRNRTRNVILLDAGDQYQGTPWFFYYKGKAASHFMTELQYDVMSLGNHEFDNGVEGLVPFLGNITFPVVCANIHLDKEPRLSGIKRSTILRVDGERIGVVGYLTTETPILAKTGEVEFEDEVTGVQKEVDRLTREGVNKIIALGHAGFDVDKNIARNVKGIDVVIGGHTNTFLYTGTRPSKEVPEGPYPLVITQDTGDKVLVLEAYAFGKYLGHIDLVFDENGRVTNWTGNPILLNKDVEQDPIFLEKLNTWGDGVRALYSKVIGSSDVFLNGAYEQCRLRECVLGNLITDAIADNYRRDKWPNLRIALMNGGGIRASIGEGNITYGDVIQTMPFQNTIDIIEINGTGLIELLEYAVANYSEEIRHGKFFQMSGLKVTYNMNCDNSGKVQKVEIVCSKCADGHYVPIKADELYLVALPSYLAEGGDGYDMIKSLWKQHYNLGDIDSDIFVNYLKRSSPVSPRVEGRISVVLNGTVAAAGVGCDHLVPGTLTSQSAALALSQLNFAFNVLLFVFVVCSRRFLVG